MSYASSSTGLSSEACWSRCGRDATTWFCCSWCPGPAPPTAPAGSARYLLCQQCASAWACPFCRREARALDLTADSDAARSEAQTVAASATNTGSASVSLGSEFKRLRLDISDAGRAARVPEDGVLSSETGAAGVAKAKAPATVNNSNNSNNSNSSNNNNNSNTALLVAEVQEQRQLIARLQAENEALRQQVADHQNAPVDDHYEASIMQKLQEFREMPKTLLRNFSGKPGLNSAKIFGSSGRNALIHMLFERFDYAGTGVLSYEQAVDLSDALGRNELTQGHFQSLCEACGATADSGLSCQQFTQLYERSSRRPRRDLRAVLARGMAWRISWWQLVDLVLQKVDSLAGGRCAAFASALFPLPGIPQDLQFPDMSPLFLEHNLSPDHILDTVQERAEELQSMFYEWGCWMRQHRSSMSCESRADLSEPLWNTSCSRCGAAPEALTAEFRCQGCGEARCVFRSVHISGMPEAKARRVEALHEAFLKLLAGLGFVFKPGFVEPLFGAFVYPSLATVRAPPQLPSSDRPGQLAPRSLLHRLAARASETSAARARGMGYMSANALDLRVELSREEFLAGRLFAWKVERSISEETHVLIGPKDSNCNFVPKPAEEIAGSISWPLAYVFLSRSHEAVAVALPPCAFCGRIFFRQEDLEHHRQFAHLSRAWAFKEPDVTR